MTTGNGIIRREHLHNHTLHAAKPCLNTWYCAQVLERSCTTRTNTRKQIQQKPQSASSIWRRYRFGSTYPDQKRWSLTLPLSTSEDLRNRSAQLFRTPVRWAVKTRCLQRRSDCSTSLTLEIRYFTAQYLGWLGARNLQFCRRLNLQLCEYEQYENSMYEVGSAAAWVSTGVMFKRRTGIKATLHSRSRWFGRIWSKSMLSIALSS